MKDYYFFLLVYVLKEKIIFFIESFRFNLIKNVFKYFFSKKGVLIFILVNFGGFVVLDDEKDWFDV